MLDFALVDFAPAYHFFYKLEGFYSAEVTILAEGVVEIFFVAFQENIVGYIIVPDVFVLDVYKRQPLCVKGDFINSPFLKRP